MNAPTKKNHFHVRGAARAYGILLVLSGLLLALGLALPLVLASSASSQLGDSHANAGTVRLRGGSAGSSGNSSAAAASTDKIPDTAQGITAHSIKVGVVLLDLSSVATLGLGLPNWGVDIQKAEFNSLINAVNKSGGIAGRKIIPVYASRNPLATTGPHSDHAICVNLADDQKVFALIGFTYAAGDCASSQYHLPVVTQNGELQQSYQSSTNLLVTIDPMLERDAQNWGTVLVDAGLLKGRKPGILSVQDGSTYQLPAKALAEKLKALGHPVAVLGESSPSSLADLPNLVEKMKSRGVNSVLLASDYLTAIRFIYFAESQHYYPQYLTSDLGSLATNGLLANAGKSLNGAIGFTNSDLPPAGQTETDADRECRERYNATTNLKPIPAGASSVLPPACAIFEVFTRAAADAGTNPNPRSFIQAVERLGSMGGLPAVLPGTFAPGKTDYSDGLRPVRWSSASRSYSPAGPPVTLK